MHQRGINMRYLGKISKLIEETSENKLHYYNVSNFKFYNNIIIIIFFFIIFYFLIFYFILFYFI